MVGRQTKGRQKIPIRRIENQDDMYATFSKRRLGLYKKASELSTLCGIDIGVLIFSPTDNPFSFFHPLMESVVERYMNPNSPVSDYTRLVEAHSRSRIEYFNQRLDKVLEMKEKMKEREKHLDETDRTRPKGWWEQVAVEDLDRHQVKKWIELLESIRARVSNRVDKLKNGTTLFHLQRQQVENVVSLSGPNMSNNATGLSLYGPTGETVRGADGLLSSQHRNGTLQGQCNETRKIVASYFQTPAGGSTQVQEQPVQINPAGQYYRFSGFPVQVDDPGIGKVPSHYIFPGPASQGWDTLTRGQSTGNDPSSVRYAPAEGFKGPDCSNGGEGGGNDLFWGQNGCFPQQGNIPGDASESGGGGEGDSQ